MKLGCRCTHTYGKMFLAYSLSSDGVSWTHPDCGQPSHANILRENMLNIMRGGPHHNELHETQELVSNPANIWIKDYRWTPERITGSLTGREARVWVYKEPET